MIIHVQYITVTLHSSISRKDPIFFSFTQTMLAGWQYIIIQYTIQVKTSKDWFIFYILEKNGTKEF